MILERARLIRAKMEAVAVEWSDETALDFTEFFPQWRVGVEYEEGKRAQDEGTLYKCRQKHVSQADWKPSITPALWRVVTLEEWPEWEQPAGAHDAYAYGAKVSHNGKHWISDLAANIYEPGVAGWHEAE